MTGRIYALPGEAAQLSRRFPDDTEVEEPSVASRRDGGSDLPDRERTHHNSYRRAAGRVEPGSSWGQRGRKAGEKNRSVSEPQCEAQLPWIAAAHSRPSHICSTITAHQCSGSANTEPSMPASVSWNFATVWPAA